MVFSSRVVLTLYSQEIHGLSGGSMEMVLCTAAMPTVQAACTALSAFGHNAEVRERVRRTVDHLAEISRFVVSVHHVVQGATGILESCEPDAPIDADGSLTGMVEEAQGEIEELVAMLNSARSEVASSERIVGAHRRDIQRAYSDAISAFTALHEAAERLRWTILEKDADLSTKSETFTSAESLIASLKG